MLKRSIYIFITAAVIIILASCATTSERIKENTGRYNGRVVRLYGEIPVIVKIPLTSISVYQFRDKTGSVIVLSAAKHKKNDKFMLKGTVAAFPEDSSKEITGDLIDISKKFIVENGIMTKDKAGKAAAAAGKAIAGFLSALGHVFIITENI